MQLAQHFLDATLRDFGREPVSLTQQQVESLRSYDWPGNVRELKNVIERAVILSRDGRLRLDLGKSDAPAIPEGLEGAGAPGADREAQKDDILTEDEMKAFQRRNMLRALERSGWKVSGKDGAAALLGLRPTTLADRIRAFDLKKPAA